MIRLIPRRFLFLASAGVLHGSYCFRPCMEALHRLTAGCSVISQEGILHIVIFSLYVINSKISKDLPISELIIGYNDTHMIQETPLPIQGFEYEC